MEIFDQLHETFRNIEDNLFDNTVYNYDYVGNFLNTVSTLPDNDKRLKKCFKRVNITRSYDHYGNSNGENVIFKNFRLKDQNNKLKEVSLEINGHCVEKIQFALKPILKDFVPFEEKQYKLNTNLDKIQLFYRILPFELNSKLLNYINPVLQPLGLKMGEFGIPYLRSHKIEIFMELSEPLDNNFDDKLRLCYDVYESKITHFIQNLPTLQLLMYQWQSIRDFTHRQIEVGKTINLPFNHPIVSFVGISDHPIENFVLKLDQFEIDMQVNKIEQISDGFFNIYHFPNSINFSMVDKIKIENNQFKDVFVYGKNQIVFMCGMGGLTYSY